MSNYTPEQFAALAPYEEHFRTAINAKWSRNPGRTALKTIYDNYAAATGSKDRFNPWCGNCVLNLMRKAGALYFEDKKAQSEKTSPDKEGREAKKAAAESAQKPRKTSDTKPAKSARTSAKKDGEKTPAKTKKAAKTEK